MTSGHPQLLAAITAEIAVSGSMTFARFMELALYHPRFGYYTNPDRAAERIGFAGDYYTTSDVHPVMGKALARQIAEVDTILGHPERFMVIEMGPGKGLLARDVIAELQGEDPGLVQRLQYTLVERSPALQLIQRRTLHAVEARISWLDSLRDLGPRSVVGVLFSNELVDAFPVHRICVQGGVKEVYVQLSDGQLSETLGPLSCRELAAYLLRLQQAGITLPDGYRTEMNIEACRWIEEVAGVLDRGIVLTIDYGHTAQDLYGPDRPRGTLLCYQAQRISENPYEYVGMQDITAHVDFTMLAAVGEQAGLPVTGFTNQMNFLIGLGMEQMLEAVQPESPEFQSMVHLLRPEGMGRTFKILVQHKGIPHPVLSGLHYRPFFDDILSQAKGTSCEALGREPQVTMANSSDASHATDHGSRS